MSWGVTVLFLLITAVSLVLTFKWQDKRFLILAGISFFLTYFSIGFNGSA